MNQAELNATYARIASDWHADHLNDTWSMDATKKFAALFQPGALILDVGCAGGIKSRLLVERGLRVVGIDAVPEFIEIAKREVPSGDFRVMDMRDAASLPETFDGIYVLASLLHIPKAEAREVLRGLVKKLKPGGYLYVAVKEQVPGHPEEEKVIENDYGYQYERFFSFYTLSEMIEHATALGLTVKDAEVFGTSVRWVHVLGLKEKA